MLASLADPCERFLESAVVKTIKHPPVVIIWSCISARALEPLYFVNVSFITKNINKQIMYD